MPEKSFSEGLKKLISETRLSDNQKNFLRSYWLGKVLSMEALGDRYSKIYNVLNVWTILGSVLVSILLIIGTSADLSSIFRSIAIILSILVAVGIGLQQSFHFGERSREYKRIARYLEEEAWQFFRLNGLYSHYHTHASGFPTFVKRNELITGQTQEVVISDQISDTIAQDVEQEATLQSYLDHMSELLTDVPLRVLKPDTEPWQIARARTLTTLRRLDPHRKGILLQFLYELGLIKYMSDSSSITILREADLSGADLRGADLREANLIETNLSAADLSAANLSAANLSAANLSAANLNSTNLRRASLRKANLNAANLSKTNLSGADLSMANLNDANLSYADLSGADLKDVKLEGVDLRFVQVTEGQLGQAVLLQGAIMPDGSRHP